MFAAPVSEATRSAPTSCFLPAAAAAAGAEYVPEILNAAPDEVRATRNSRGAQPEWRRPPKNDVGEQRASSSCIGPLQQHQHRPSQCILP